MRDSCTPLPRLPLHAGGNRYKSYAAGPFVSYKLPGKDAGFNLHYSQNFGGSNALVSRTLHLRFSKPGRYGKPFNHMSIKTLLMPMLTQHLLARSRLLKKRERAMQARLRNGQTRVLHYFHQVDDPYSVLVAQSLAALQQRYDLKIIPHLVNPPGNAAAPERARLQTYSRRDAILLAQKYDLHYPPFDQQPEPGDIAMANRLLQAAIYNERFIATVAEVSHALWHAPATISEQTCAAQGISPATAAMTQQKMQEADQLRQALGHYLGAMFLYEGEWYWGIDRLYHLEQRLQTETGASIALLYPPVADLSQPLLIANPPEIDFFLSFRSPYSAIVAERVFKLARLTGAKLNLRYLLPMVMRGLPVPAQKRTYIVFDTAREAHARNTPFGRLNDPVGRPTERALAIMPLAEKLGLGQAYVLSFMRGVWAEGIDAGSDSGLRKICERAGINWNDARAAMQDDGWRTVAETNRMQMFALGLWGVPSYHCAGTAVWGQDRLWVITDIFKRLHAEAEELAPEQQQLSIESEA